MIAAFRAIYPCWWRSLAPLTLGFAALYLLLVVVVVDPIAGAEIEKQPLIAQSQAVSYVAALGDRGRLVYGIQQGIDVLFVLAYAATLAIAVVAAGRVLPRLVTIVALLLIGVAVIADLAEDVMLIALIWPVDFLADAASGAIGVTVAVKLASVAIAIVVTFTAGARATMKARSVPRTAE